MSTRDNLKRWRQPGSAGFFAFLEDVKPMVPTERGGFEPYEIPNEGVRREIQIALDGGYSTIIWCWPRRHGKTLIAALVIIWRFLTRKHQSVAIVANSMQQTTDTAFKTVRSILQQTPYTERLIDSEAIQIFADRIVYEAMANELQGFPSNPAALFGKKLALAQISELHATASDAAYQALASSTIDTDDGLTMVDSTVGPRSSPLYGLYQLWTRGDDPTLYFSHIEYRDLEDAVRRRPKWIKEDRIQSRAAQMLPAEFAQLHLNQWTAGASALFPPEVLELCKDDYPLDPNAIADGRTFAVGAGLDRAYGFSLHGDATVTAAVMKVVHEEVEHFYVLACDDIRFSTASGIKKALSRYHQDLGMRRASLESYNVQDIAAWAAEQPFDHETVSATAERQSNAFTAVYSAAAEGRLHIAPVFKKLLDEMATMEYELVNRPGGTVAKFEHAKGAHDDHVYALVWAIYALRDYELAVYTIEGISCDASPRIADLCVLNGGDLVPLCSDQCRSFQSVKTAYDKWKYVNKWDDLDLSEFFQYKMRNTGYHSRYR